MEPRIVFISYVEEDGALVKTLAQELRGLGHSTWIYEEDGLAGISYLEQVLEAIDGCQFFILVASEKSVRSRQVIREVEHAYEAEKLIIPVRVGLNHQQFVESNPILRMACGTAVTLAASNDPSALATQIARTLRSTALHKSPEPHETSPRPGGADRPVERTADNTAIANAGQGGRQEGQGSSRIFVSYRREAAEGHILLLQQLREHFGKHRVFKRAGTMEPGQDFAREIAHAQSGSVMLVVIGAHWLTINDAGRRRRLDDPEDDIRLEVAAALENQNLKVIPVLVGGASMPNQKDLPIDLWKLTARQAVELRDDRWDNDVRSLILTLEAGGL